MQHYNALVQMEYLISTELVLSEWWFQTAPESRRTGRKVWGLRISSHLADREREPLLEMETAALHRRVDAHRSRAGRFIERGACTAMGRFEIAAVERYQCTTRFEDRICFL